MKNIYLDNNATTKVDPEVISAMMPFFEDHWGNPSSIHRFGGMVNRHIEEARAKVATLLNCKPTEIFFTGCGTESNNMALKGFVEKNGINRSKIVTTVVEHPAILETAKYLATEGAHLYEVEVDGEGMLNVDDLIKHVDKDTIVSVMWANNETGVIFPIEEIAKKVKELGGTMHTDAVQAVGKIDIDLQKVPVDMLSLSGHKLHAPKGVGVIFIREGVDIANLMHGGHQEGGRRAGTENVPYIVGLGKACELAVENIEIENTTIRAMRDRLQNTLLKSCKDAVLNGNLENRLPNTANISFEFIEGEAILLWLDESGIAASSGSACTTGSLEPSHVMRAMGLPYVLAHSSIRFSFSKFNTEEDVDKVIEVMPGIVDKLRAISPFVK
jgi:cysteine desulfurase